MPDGNEFFVRFSDLVVRLEGLQKLIVQYLVKEQYVLFFDFVGRSHFLVSIYNDKGEDVFAFLR